MVCSTNTRVIDSKVIVMKTTEAWFFDQDGNPVPQDDPSAVLAEIVETDDDGTEVRTYAEVG